MAAPTITMFGYKNVPYLVTGFRGICPTGTCALVWAESEKQAFTLLRMEIQKTPELAAMNVDLTIDNVTLRELTPERAPSAEIILNGDY